MDNLKLDMNMGKVISGHAKTTISPDNPVVLVHNKSMFPCTPHLKQWKSVWIQTSMAMYFPQ